MWRDGQLVMNVPHTISSGDFPASTPFYLLRDTNEVNRWLGDVDEFAVYKGVLSQAEIVDHYNNGAGKYYASVSEAPVVAQAQMSDYKTVSYSPPTTTLMEADQMPLMQTSTIASFTYDGDGRQVKAVVGGVTTYYVGAHYQVDNGVVTKYYFAGAQRVAMRKNGTLYYLLADHLGSTSLTTNTSGALVSELRYKAWGETRHSSGTTPTSYRYTGQREEPGIGLYFYNARWFDPLIGRFTSADTIIPGGVQGLDRYAYVNNAPTRFIDPSGHKCIPVEECEGYKPGSYRGHGGISLSTHAKQLITFAKSMGMTPEEVIGIGLGREMFGDNEEQRKVHMELFRNGFLGDANDPASGCNGNPTYNCMLNYFSSAYESVYNQFLDKGVPAIHWETRDEYILEQAGGNLSENNQDIVTLGVEFMLGNESTGSFMDTISEYSFNPNLASNSDVVDAQALNKYLHGYPTSDWGFLVVKRG